MIVLLDISQRVLGQSLNTERQYMSIMNSTTSHEMRNPLNSISSNIEAQNKLTSELKNLMSRAELSPVLQREADGIFNGYQKSLRISKSSCQMMMFNVEDLLALPQMKQGKLPKHISQVNFKEAVNEVADIMDFMLQIKGIEL